MIRSFSIWISAIAFTLTTGGCASSQPMAPCPRIPASTTAETKIETKAPLAEVVSLDAGAISYDLSISETAQIFHIADQLSGWSPFMHPQYARWANEQHVLGDRQNKALEAHRALRQRLHYGGLDQTFYTTESVQVALSRAASFLSSQDLATEKNLFEQMTPILLPLIQKQKADVVALRDRILKGQEKLKGMVDDFVHFAQVYLPKMRIPVWLIASTDSQFGGGGYNGGQMVVEASRAADDVLLHETLHFVLDPKQSDLDAAAKSCGAGLDYGTLEEGIAYALYPGIVGKRDSIDRTIAQLASNGKPVSDPYVRFNRLGKRLTPLLEKALVEKTTLATMLPAACDEWKKVAATPWP